MQKKDRTIIPVLMAGYRIVTSVLT